MKIQLFSMTVDLTTKSIPKQTWLSGWWCVGGFILVDVVNSNSMVWLKLAFRLCLRREENTHPTTANSSTWIIIKCRSHFHYRLSPAGQPPNSSIEEYGTVVLLYTTVLKLEVIGNSLLTVKNKLARWSKCNNVYSPHPVWSTRASQR